MPLYFAYGSNLDRPAMAGRCPRSRPLGLARLRAHQFFIMHEGYASVRPVAGATAHGLVWDLADVDVAALDEYEEVDAGLYGRSVMQVEAASGPVDALVYRGSHSDVGVSRPGYMECVVAAAAACGLPPGYCLELRGWLPPAR